jgi:hypothetical protein
MPDFKFHLGGMLGRHAFLICGETHSQTTCFDPDAKATATL